MSRQLQSCLSLEAAAIGLFIELLDSEAQAMSDGNFALLPELAERKTQQTGKILLARSEREARQLTLGYAADRDGAQAATAAGGPALQQAWRELQQQAELARQSNLRNGVMIHTHLEFTRQSIDFLQARGQQALYGPNGTHHTGSGPGNSLGLG